MSTMMKMKIPAATSNVQADRENPSPAISEKVSKLSPRRTPYLLTVDVS